MKRTTPNYCATLAFALMTLSPALAVLGVRAEPASSPAGFYKVDCLGNSDTIVSIPFTRPEAAFALVDSIGGIDNNVVTVQGTPGWTADQFVYAAGTQSNTYYLRFLSGPKEGSYYPILDNDVNTLTLDLSGDDISSVTNGSRLAVIPYWTLATAFPEGKGIIPSTTDFNRKTEILVPDFTSAGINLGISATYYYFAAGGSNYWRRFGSLSTNKNDDILLPDVYFILRHNTSTSTVFTAQGSVPESNLAIALFATGSAKQDNYVALTRPLTISLNASGLVESGAFSPSPNSFNRTDELFVYDNTATQKNKSIAGTYYYRDSAWRKFGDLDGDYGNEPVFVPGTGVIIRKGAGNSTNWINVPTWP